MEYISKKPLNLKTQRTKFSAYPPKDIGNPSIQQFHEELSKSEYILDSFNFKFINLWKHRKTTKFLLFHWPSSLWRKKNKLTAYFFFSRFYVLCKFGKFLGYNFIWSAHNTIPHDYYFEELEIRARQFILKNFDIIINHSLNASKERFELFKIKPKKEILVIHGHYENHYNGNGYYTREKLNISKKSKVIYLHANNKSYKCDNEFINSFSNYLTENITLIITGNIKNTITQKNIIHITGFISNSHMGDLIALSDFIALPYKKITTSGAFMLAITFNKAIIASKLPFFQMHGNSKICLFYDINNEKELNNVFRKIEDGWENDLSESNRLKRKYSWENSVIQLISEIKEI